MESTVLSADKMIAQAATPPDWSPWKRSPSRFGWAGCLSAAAHGVVLLLAMGLVVRVPTQGAPIRVFLREQAPPPPAGSGQVAAVQPQAATQPEPVHPVVHETASVQPRVSHIRKRPRARKPAPAPAANNHPDASAPLTAATGQAGGVPGGIAGGIIGGMVGGTGRTLIPAEQAAHIPVPITKIMPDYPRIARLHGIEGQVVLEAIVDEHGSIEPNITVVQSVPIFDAATIAALRQWRFRPARDEDGAPLRVSLRVPFRFVLR